MSTPQETARGDAPDPRRGRWRRRLGIGCLTVVVLAVVAAAVLWWTKPWAPEVVVADPGPEGETVGDGLVGTLYPADERAPGLLVLGGSEGGLADRLDEQARLLRDEGYTVLALSYFGADGQPAALEEIPLETFDAGLDALADHPMVDPERLGALGTSKGAEAVLRVATERSDLDAVVAMAPSSVVWQGIDPQQPWRMTSIGSSWSEDGAPVPYLPYPDGVPRGDLVDYYQGGLDTLGEHPDAAIRVEDVASPVLLVCGEADTLWPSCTMADQVATRSDERDGTDVTVLRYADAGHFAGGPPLAADDPFRDELAELGGTVEGNAAAREDSWPRVLSFLEEQLGR